MGQMDNLQIDNPTVEAVGRMNFSGNIIPNSWFRTLCDKSGHPYMNAIVILADIRYWYTPTEVRDEESGQTIGFKKKFRADALQRSRNKFSEQFGLSLKQVDAALDYLQECGIIKKEIRNDVMFNGRKVGNTMYILLDAEVLYHYTYPEEFLYPDRSASSETAEEMDEEILENSRETKNKEGTVSLQGEGVFPYRGRGYSPTGREGIPLRGERVSPCGDRHTYNNTYINTENNSLLHLQQHHRQGRDGKEDEYLQEIFTELCSNIRGIRMTKDNGHALSACVKKYPEISRDIMLFAARFSASTCLSKASSSRIRYLAAVLSTLRERQINTFDGFQQFQLEYRKRKQKEWDCSTEFQREYDFEQLERQLVMNQSKEPESG